MKSNITILMAFLLIGCTKAPQISIDIHDVTEITESTATVSATVSIPGEVMSFRYDYGTSQTELNKSINLLFAKDGLYKATISTLDPGATYYYQPTFSTKDGEYSGEIRSFTTKSFIPTAVDLGLSVKWGTTNVGAYRPEDGGYYYAWGEIEPKDSYNWGTYKWMQEGKGDPLCVTKYQFPDTRYMSIWYDSNQNFIGDGKRVLEAEDDVATVKWGKPWRTPTWEECVELMEKCTWTWEQINGHNGYNVTGPNGNSIFLPAAGCRTKNDINSLNTIGCYWTASLFWQFSYTGAELYFDSASLGWNNDWMGNGYARLRGQTVRPVSD
ncbi:MAG: hypothetical protein MJZ09_01365 [Bacteroidales bacterium]|nr:hypothetical protein [Bacteroidales bacterium]